MFSKDTYFVGSKFPKFAKKGSIAVNTTTGTINYLEPDGDWISVSAEGGNANTGDITFDGVQIRGAGTGSGDGYNNGTIELVPDADLYDNGQRLIIDPTGPNHIHIRAGENIYGGSSNPELYLGDDKANVGVVTWSGDVNINTQNRPRILVQNTNTGSGSTLNYDSNSYNYDWEVYDTLLLEDGTEFQVTGYGEGSVTVEGFTFTPNNYYYFADNLNTYKWHFRNNGMFELQNSNGMDLGIKVSQIKFGNTDAYNSSKIGTDGYQIALYSEDGIKISDENGAEYLKFEKSYTGASRIIAPDDLALRAANDIILYPGETSDGVGKVYIGWGDDSMDTSESNEVATKGDISDLSTVYAPKESPTFTGTMTFPGFIDPDINATISLSQFGNNGVAGYSALVISSGSQADELNSILQLQSDQVSIQAFSSQVDITATLGVQFSVDQTNGIPNVVQIRGPINGQTSGDGGARIIFPQGRQVIYGHDDKFIIESETILLDGDLKVKNSSNQIVTGATGSYTTASHTVTVTNGIITEITAL